MCWFGWVWTFDLLADVIEFRGLLKINVMKLVGKQMEINKTKSKINKKYGKDDEKCANRRKQERKRT